jgi:hypothetical protein
MVEADDPPAFWPRNAASASANSPQEMHRNEHLQALRAARIGRQDRRGKTDAIRGIAKSVAHPRHRYLNWANPGHDRSLRQVAMAHHPLSAVSGALVGVLREEVSHLGFDGLGEQRSRAIAQNLRQSIGCWTS